LHGGISGARMMDHLLASHHVMLLVGHADCDEAAEAQEAEDETGRGRDHLPGEIRMCLLSMSTMINSSFSIHKNPNTCQKDKGHSRPLKVHKAY